MEASSSGVPEVMGFLNGNVVSKHFSLTAYIVKFISCSAGVSAGPVSYTHLTLPTNREV